MAVGWPEPSLGLSLRQLGQGGRAGAESRPSQGSHWATYGQPEAASGRRLGSRPLSVSGLGLRLQIKPHSHPPSYQVWIFAVAEYFKGFVFLQDMQGLGPWRTRRGCRREDRKAVLGERLLRHGFVGGTCLGTSLMVQWLRLKPCNTRTWV